jgi:hypothetical protein
VTAIFPDPERLSKLHPNRQRLLTSGNCQLDLRRQVAGVGSCFQDPGAFHQWKRRAKSEKAFVVAGCLAVSAKPCRVACGVTGVAQHRCWLTCFLGVVGEASRVATVRRCRFEDTQNLCVQGNSPRGRDGMQDSFARQLMTEPQRLSVCQQHTRRQTGFEICRSRSGDVLQHGAVNGRANNRGRFEQRPGGRLKPRRAGKDGVAYRRRNFPARREDFGDKEWISSRPVIEICGVQSAAVGKRADGARRQRSYRQPLHRGNRRQFAEDSPQRMAGTDFVIAIGGHDQPVGRLDAAAEKAKEIQRRLIRPVYVFDGQQRGTSLGGKAVQEGTEEQIARGIVLQQVEERRVRNVEQRTERSWC